MSFAAYMLMHGAKLISAQKIGASYSFVLELGDLNIRTLQVSYVNSEVAKFDAAVRGLKTILFGSNQPK